MEFENRMPWRKIGKLKLSKVMDLFEFRSTDINPSYYQSMEKLNSHITGKVQGITNISKMWASCILGKDRN